MHKSRMTSFAALAVVLGGCFQVEPLADCSSAAGLYVRHHVCMPLAGPPLLLAGKPEELVVGDFDDDGFNNDLAILLDPDLVRVFAPLDLDAPTPTREIEVFDGELDVEALLPVRYLDGAAFGQDLIVWSSDPDPDFSAETATIVALRNGGDAFASGDRSDVLLGWAKGPGDTLVVANPCPMPGSGVALGRPGSRAATAVVISCEQADAALTQGIVILNLNFPGVPFSTHPQGPLPGDSGLLDIRGTASAAIDTVGAPDILIAHRPRNDKHDQLTIVLFDTMPTGTIELEPEQRSIDQIASADLDRDGDIDIVLLHEDNRGFSVILQSAPLEFDEPRFYSPGYETGRLALGDFTGDSEVDVAVAHVIDNTTQNAITIFARDPDPGAHRLTPATAGSLDGSIVELVVLDHDRDGRDDLAAAVRTGTRGSVWIYLNRSPGDVAGP